MRNAMMSLPEASRWKKQKLSGLLVSNESQNRRFQPNPLSKGQGVPPAREMQLEPEESTSPSS